MQENDEMAEELDNSVANSALQAYMTQVKRYARSKEETAALNQSLSREYAKTLSEFEQSRKVLAEQLTSSLGRVKAENVAEMQALQLRDLGVRSKLINLNLRLVVKIVNEYPALRPQIMDLISEGNIGLMKGVDRFDPSREVPLANYVADWIRAYCIRYIMNNARLVKLGTTESQRKLFFNLNKERARLEAQGIEITDALLAKNLKVDETEVTEMTLRLSAPDASLQIGAESEEDSGPRMDDLEAEGELPDFLIEARQNKALRQELFAQFRATLPDKLTRKSKRNLYQEVFDRRFMRLGEEEEETLDDIAWGPSGLKAEERDITRQRVQQVDAEVWQRLVDFFHDELGGPV